MPGKGGGLPGIQRCGLTAYHYDHHDARGHDDRRLARRVRMGEAAEPPNLDEVWVLRTPAAMAEETLGGFSIRFEWALEDLRALDSGRPVVAEGWGLRPQLVARFWIRRGGWWCW